MKNIYLLGIGIFALGIQSCSDNVEVAPEFENTKWISEDGTKTLEFTDDNVLFDGEEQIDGSEVYHAEEVNGEGQFWVQEGSEKMYKYDYKLSGNNLFVAPEDTDSWGDPSSAKVENAVKYQQEK